jgi:hypothetical protein
VCANTTEYKTRRDKIDVLLHSAGWDVKDQTLVVIEVDTKQSDFKKRVYKTVKDTLRDPDIDEKAYADYLLLDESGSTPLADCAASWACGSFHQRIAVRTVTLPISVGNRLDRIRATDDVRKRNIPTYLAYRTNISIVLIHTNVEVREGRQRGN